MEDRFSILVHLEQNKSLFAIFDGNQISHYLMNNFFISFFKKKKKFLKNTIIKIIKKYLKNLFFHLYDEIKKIKKYY